MCSILHRQPFHGRSLTFCPDRIVSVHDELRHVRRRESDGSIQKYKRSHFICKSRVHDASVFPPDAMISHDDIHSPAPTRVALSVNESRERTERNIHIYLSRRSRLVEAPSTAAGCDLSEHVAIRGVQYWRSKEKREHRDGVVSIV